jgi:ubiquinol-cytochrome c reductase cytochrome c1 subunit
MKKIQTITCCLFFLFTTSNILAASKVELDNANTDIGDKQSLKNGFELFTGYCLSCHSIKFSRYSTIANDLDIDDNYLKNNLLFGDRKVGDTIKSPMLEKYANKWFGLNPPDLSLIARSNGVDYIYTYLKSFYKDDSRPFGVNNKVLIGSSMPDVLSELRLSQSEKEFDKNVRDITNFLDYVGEPAKIIRTKIGYYVLGFLFVLLIFSYLLKKEYWKDVKYGKWRQKK